MNPISEALARLRQDYQMSALDEHEAPDNPVSFFEKWFAEAKAAGELEPNAMTLATSDKQGNPSARIVLLKGLEAGRFVFYTNYQSRKGQELLDNPKAALLFFWQTLERQVRIEGTVLRVSPETSDAYFNSRPEGSRIGALASPQSRQIDNRAWLEQEYSQLAEKYKGKQIPRPEHWGGFAIEPYAIEFWQGRSSRLHDRLFYQKTEQGWTCSRLAP